MLKVLWSTPYFLPQITKISIKIRLNTNRTVVVGTDVLQPVESVRNHGVYFDNKLSTQTHVAKVTQ